MSGPIQLYLVPGFFGFVNFGDLIYFSHVREFLDAELSTRGRRADIYRCATSPTASITTRASELVRFIAETAEGDGPIAIIGHSTGGLDARLVATPGVALDGDLDPEPIAARIESITSIASPHRGTPMASFFTGLLGQKLLKVLSLLTLEVLREGPIPVAYLAKLGATLARMRLPGSKSAKVLDHLYEDLLGRLPGSERDQVSSFMATVALDQALLPQLTPAGLDLFNASAVDRPKVRYGCVVARASRPHFRNRVALRFDLWKQAAYAFYQWLHALAGFNDNSISWEPSPEQREQLLGAYGEETRPSDNDGIVPTLSQLHGELIHATTADHLDVIGHFDDEGHQPPHHDWLTTCSHFDRGRFESLWTSVADFISTREES
ncbi:MAG: triacylglycerol lipase [Deltaproteobacteria bacterium]|jgi:hypothetical protein|nr:triacylglycerol lipase [Deltaproteobacteria bacterium]